MSQEENHDFVAIRRASCLGFQDALSDPQTYEKAFEALSKYSSSQTGKFFLGSIATVLKKILVFGLIAAGIYAIGGWHGLAAFIKSSFQ
jgi:alanine-alpha-ketoisovalerate/valine-pyruvate aminotransferase